MASLLVSNTSQQKPFEGHGAALALAGSRKWLAVQTGTVTLSANTGLHLLYSDDDGASWTYHDVIDSSTTGNNIWIANLVTYAISGTQHLEILYHSTLTNTA